MAEELDDNTDDIEASIVEYFYERQVQGHKCGYCESKDSFMTNSMWAHRLAGQDYQDLIDRGWRRSGKYMYKPIMNRTCCPLYAIRCEALVFKPSRSQKRVANRMRAFLVEGKECPKKTDMCDSNQTNDASQKHKAEEDEEEESKPTGEENKETGEESKETGEESKETGEESKETGEESKETGEESKETEGDSESETKADTKQVEPGKPDTKKKTPRPGDGADPNKPRCRKAKELRLEKRRAKLAAKGGVAAKEGETGVAAKEGEAGVAAKEGETGVAAKEGETDHKEETAKESVAGYKDEDSATGKESVAEKEAGKESVADKEASLRGKEKAGQKRKKTNGNKAKAKKKQQSNSKPVPETNPIQTTIGELLKLPSDQKMAHRLEVKVVECYPPSPELTSTFLESYALYKKYQMAVHGDKEEDLSERSFRRFLCDTPLISLDGPRGWDSKYGTFHYQYYLDGKLLMVAVVDILPTYLSSVYVYYDPDYRWLELGVYSSLREIELVQILNHNKPEFQYYCMGYYVHNNPKMMYKGNYSPSFLLCPETYRYMPIKGARQRLHVAKYSPFSDDPVEPERVLSFLGGVLILFEKQVIPYMLFRSYYGHVKDRIVVEYASLVGKEVTQRMFLYLMLDGQQEMEDSDD